MTPNYNESLDQGDLVRRNAAARIYLQPIAAPSILGLCGFAGATFMVAAHFAGWYGGGDTVMYLIPFVAIFRLGRRWKRSPASPGPAGFTSPPVTPS
jgi:hypothetical protein